MSYHLAQVNVGRFHAPLDDDQMAEFAAALDPINELAEASPGFVWRLTDEDGQPSSYLSVSDDPLLAINLSVWESVEALRAFVFETDHRDYLRRRRQWFAPIDEAYAACWWIPAGQLPTVGEALDALKRLEADGPSDDLFGFKPPFPPPPDQRTS